jgi:fatty acid-binding protein DegV
VDGKLALLQRVRTWRKSWNRVIELAQKERSGRPIERLAIAHANNPAEARQFQELICQALPCPPDLIFTELNPGMSPHSGAGMIGVAFVTGS